VSFPTFLINLLYGFTIGSILILISSSLSLIFGVMGVVNLAHGSLCMLGAYFGLTLVLWTGNFWLALIVAPIVVAFIGFLMEVYTLRPLYGLDPLLQLFLTLGLSMIVSNLVLHFWGGDVRSISIPEALKGNVLILGTVYPSFRLFVFIVSISLVISIWFLITQTKWGIILRAGVHNMELVDALGINISWVFTLVFTFGCGLSSVAGVIIGALHNCNTNMHTDLLIWGLLAVVIGGLGSFRGAVIGSLILGVSEAFGALLMPGLAKFTIYTVMVVILLLRPEGLLKEI
jgi:branched-subunit amino acid ABC-type transport system permease component